MAVTKAKDATVFIVDDDRAIRKSLRWLLESVGLRVRAFSSARTFLAAYDPEAPGCLVLDVRMPGMSGLELQEQLREQGIEVPVIVLTGYGDVPMAVRAMKAGALDFLEKPVSDQILLDHIQRALARDAAARQRRSEYRSVQERLHRLSSREREVLEGVVTGLCSREIAEELGLSVKTVESHRVRIMKKMQASSVPHLVRMTLLATAQ